MTLPYDIARCNGEYADKGIRYTCLHRDACLRFAERHDRGPLTSFLILKSPTVNEDGCDYLLKDENK